MAGGQRLTEAVQLRKAGQTLPILILGHVQPAYAAALIQNDITVACYSLAQARALSEAAVAAGGRVHIHLKADTGMGRIGFALRTDFDAAIREMLEACALPGLEMTGLFQHFSVADDTAPENVAYTAEQHALFVKAFHALKAAGGSLPLYTAITLPGSCCTRTGRRGCPGALHGAPRHHPVRLRPQRRGALWAL